MARNVSNRLIDALPAQERTALLARMQPVELPLGTTLYQPGEVPRYAHFITSGVASIVTFMQNGSGVEVGLIGNEGLVEALHILGAASVPTTGFIQMEGHALRMSFSDLQQEFNRSESLRQVVLQHIQGQGLIVSQLAACNRLHEVEERLARWLLMVHDRVGSTDFFLTQEFLAEMIGAGRTTVTLAAGSLQRSGLISYSRGKISIINPEELAQAACECYPIVRELLTSLYK